MATKEKEVKREVKFEYCSELSVDEYKHLRKHANFPKLSDEQIEFIFNNNGWRYCCKVMVKPEIVQKENSDLIILQSRSPSCGIKQIYDGTFSGKISETVKSFL